VKSVLYLQSPLPYALQYPHPPAKTFDLEQDAIPVKSDEHPSLPTVQNSLNPELHYPYAIPHPSFFPQLNGSDY
jgi:hypothetical protein